MKKDVFNIYGPGVVEFFNLVRGLIYVYVIICILIIPMLIIYYDGGVLGKEDVKNGYITWSTLGNLGFSMYKCYNRFYVSDENSSFKCH